MHEIWNDRCKIFTDIKSNAEFESILKYKKSEITIKTKGIQLKRE